MFFYNESDSETSPVQPTVSDPYFYNTSLLLKMDSDFSDSSVHQHTVTTVGNTAISSTKSKHGGASGYFDGSGDYLQLPYDSSLDLSGNPDWTFETWIYMPNAVPAAVTDIAGASNGPGGVPKWGLKLNQNTSYTYSPNRLGFFIYDGGPNWINVSYTWQPDTWYHIAVVNSSGITTMYVDGTSVGTLQKSIPSVTGGLRIGSDGESVGFFTGYIDDLRITKGIARYTANFTPPESLPTTGPSEIVSTDLQLHFDAGDTNSYPGTGLTWYDLGPTNSDMVLTGEAYTQIGGVDTMQFITGHGNINYNSLFEIGSEDYASELWIKTEDSTADLISAFNSSSPYTGWLFGIGFNNQPGKLSFYKNGQTGGADIVHSSAVVDNGLWNHVMFLKIGDVLKFFINGALDSTHQLISEPGAASNQTIKIGEDNNISPHRSYAGYMSELRIYKATGLTEGLVYQNFNVTKSRFGL